MEKNSREIKDRIIEINSELGESDNLQEGLIVPFNQLRKAFYRGIVGNNPKMKDEVIEAIADVYKKYGIDVTNY